MRNPLTDLDIRVTAADAAIDLSGFETVFVAASALAAPATAITFALKESDDPVFANATAVDLTQVLNAEAKLDAANQVAKIGYLGSKRYLFVTAVGGTPDGLLAVLGSPSTAPVPG
ncbi:hypothetical protein [Lysobacter sp. GCM10012299]|uniref:hypothetical protein n=1 Tax=Lysobacter sp. GCM10012299 TaxID=3317333 RepID=UPI00360C2F31